RRRNGRHRPPCAARSAEELPLTDPPASAPIDAGGGVLALARNDHEVQTSTSRSAVSWLRQPHRRSGINLLSFQLPWLEDRQVPVELPARQLHAVVVPFLALQLDVPVEDMRAERLSGQLGFRECVDRLAEGLRQRDDSPLAPLLRRE